MSDRARTVGTDDRPTDADRDAVLVAEDVSVSFTLDRGKSDVLRDVDLQVFRGETLALVGESGSGKSMLASAFLDAVEEPGVTTGDVTYYPEDGDPVSVLEADEERLKSLRWGEVSMVFQGAMSSFNPVMTIREHFRETLEEHDADVRAGMERARRILEDLYLDPDRVLDSHPHELSGGMSQRALIGLSMVLEPEVLVMDEPTSALDLLMQRAIIELLERLREEYDLTIVVISHDLPLVSELADRIGVLYAFELVETATTDEILYESGHPYTRALLRTTPSLHRPVSEMQPIEGSKPDPVERLAGCSYAERCPLADSQCVSEDPDLVELGPTHRAACFHSDRARTEITIDQAAEVTDD